MDNKTVIFSVFDGFLQCLLRLVVTFSQRFSEACAETEFQIAFLIQKCDQVLDPLEARLVKIAVEIQFKPV